MRWFGCLVLCCLLLVCSSPTFAQNGPTPAVAPAPDTGLPLPEAAPAPTVQLGQPVQAASPYYYQYRVVWIQPPLVQPLVTGPVYLPATNPAMRAAQITEGPWTNKYARAYTDAVADINKQARYGYRESVVWQGSLYDPQAALLSNQLRQDGFNVQVYERPRWGLRHRGKIVARW